MNHTENYYKNQEKKLHSQLESEYNLLGKIPELFSRGLITSDECLERVLDQLEKIRKTTKKLSVINSELNRINNEKNYSWAGCCWIPKGYDLVKK